MTKADPLMTRSGDARRDAASYNAASIRSHNVFNTMTRAKYLSLAGTITHGAIAVLVRSIMSHTARS